jgi:outer membrane protein TolC
MKNILTLFWFLVIFVCAEDCPSTLAEGIVESRQILTLDAFLKQVKQFHPTLNIAELDRRMSTARRLEKQGAFDPRINARGGFNRYNSSADIGEAQEAYVSESTFDFLTRYGIKVSTGGKLAVNDIKTPVSPTGESGEYFSKISIPLFRGAGINSKSADEKNAILGEPLAAKTYRQKELKLLLSALTQYWSWVAAQKKVEIAEELLRLAQFRIDAVKERVNAGDIAAINLVEAQQEVQKRIERFYRAQRGFQASTFKLSLFLWDTEGRINPLPVENQVLEEIPDVVLFTKNSLEAGKLAAQANRPEPSIIAISKQMGGVSLSLARNNLLPQIDAFLTPGIETGHNSINGPVILAGIKFSLPLFQRTANGKIRQAELTIDKLEVRRRQLLQEILIQVEDSVSMINTSYYRYQAEKLELKLAKQMEEGERIKFTHGDSTLFLVNRRERSTAEANVNLIDAMIEYHKAVGRFKAVTGEL